MYIKAGYVPVCGCNLRNALDYVRFQLQGETRLAADNATIECKTDLGFGLQWLQSGYYWEEETLFERR